MPPLIQWILDHAFPIASAAIGAFGFIVAARGAMAERASARWRMARGRITVSRVESDQNIVLDATEYRPPVSVARIQYAFEVDGAIRTGSSVRIGSDLHTSDHDRAERAVAVYPEGAEVQVWYDPRDPRRCCLERESGELGIGLVLGIVGVVFAAGSIAVNG